MNLQFQIRKATRAGELKISDSEVKLRSLTLGTLQEDEAKFLDQLGSNIYILSLFNDIIYDDRKKSAHRLYKASGITTNLIGTRRIERFFRSRLVDLTFCEEYPSFPKSVDQLDYVQNSVAKVGKIGEGHFLLDECNAQKLINYCVDRLIERIERTEELTYEQFYRMIDELGDLKEAIPVDKLILFTKSAEDKESER